MIKTRKSLKAKAAMLALVGFTTVALPLAPAFAGGWHGGHGGGHPQSWGWGGGHHHGGWDRGHDDNDGAAVAVAAGVGLLLGATLMAQPAQPAYYSPPPATVYAPPPAGYYAQAPIEAVPTSDVYRTASGQYCREYQSSIRVGGQWQQGYGTACLGEDGAWRVVQ
ncbi:hypothetical protein [Parvibaculum sp.]|uniref:hypothetical protein n=1 Tax=Parvibaculum sp. TaxID=2024848 RepID=UPI002C57E66E|nr:hypothetical protein [Parvibaculum sp.]HUD51411.1 hypothetical protein [Parvibaculum sp.]